jgi:hypothetical protein
LKYFPYKLIADANGWTGKSQRAQNAAHLRFEQNCTNYFRQLSGVRKRVSPSAWRFFRYGIQDESLHDATLISMTGGDDINEKSTRSPSWYRNVARMRVRLVFLSYAGDRTRTFECVGVRRLRCDLSVDGPLERNLGDLYTYELRPADRRHLALSFLFASGGEIDVEFRKLNFRTRRHKITKPEIKEFPITYQKKWGSGPI